VFVYMLRDYMLIGSHALFLYASFKHASMSMSMCISGRAVAANARLTINRF
jgi:hypothetical protein